MPRLSIVIPCLGGAAEFDGTLVSVLQNRPKDCEILVAHAAAYDDPYGLSGEVAFLQCQETSLVALVNAALERATGEIVHIVGCGLEVADGWTAAAVSHFDDREVAAVTPAVLSGDGSLANAGVRYTLGGSRHLVTDQRLLRPGTERLRTKVLGPALAAAFYRREVLVALGGLDATATDQFADVDLALAIRALGHLHICEPNSQLLQNEPVPASTAGFTRGRAAERLFWRYAALRGMTASLLLHPCALVAELAVHLPKLSALTSLIGRAVATFEFGAAQRLENRLTIAREKLAELSTLRETIRIPAARQKKQPIPIAKSQRRAA